MYTNYSIMEFAYKVTDEDTANLIKLRAANDALFTGKRNAAKFGWRAILKELGLQGKLTSDQAAKKWENLKKKYKALKYPHAGPGTEGVEVTSSPWQWFYLMNEAMEGRLSGCAPVLMTSSCGDEEQEAPAPPPRKRRRTSEKNEILDFLTEEAARVERMETEVKELAVMDSDKEVVESERGLIDKERAALDKDRVRLERDQAATDRDRAALERERAAVERDRAVLERDRAAVEKDRAALERDRAVLERERAAVEKDRAALERDRVALEQDREKTSAIVKNDTTEAESDEGSLERRKRFLSLFEKLIEKL